MRFEWVWILRTFVILALLCGSISVAGAVETVLGSTTPSVQTWQMESVWTIDADDPAYPLIGGIRACKRDSAGAFFLLDGPMGHVVMVDSTGKYLRTIGREGDGPGEVRRPQSLLLYRDGTIGLSTAFPASIVHVDGDGLPLPTIRPNYPMDRWWNCDAGFGSTVVCGETPVDQSADAVLKEKDQWLGRIDEYGNVVNTYLKKSVTFDWAHPIHDEAAQYFPRHAWAVTPEGGVVLAPDRDSYQIKYLSADGRTIRTLNRDFVPYRRTWDDFKRLKEGYMYMRNGTRINVDAKFQDTDPVIIDMFCQDDGELWVSTCYAARSLPEGIARRYDVISPDGDFWIEVRLAMDFDPICDLLWQVGHGYFLCLRNAKPARALGENDKSESPCGTAYRIECLRAIPPEY